MNQAALDLDTPPTDAVDRTGFDIGWDHAQLGLVPPPDLLHAGTPVCQGWRAGRAVFGPRALPTQRATRQWLQLRLRAWQQRVAFDAAGVTPAWLARLHTVTCPVLRMPLGGIAGAASAAVVERLDPAGGYVAGRLAVMSRQAAQAGAGLGIADLVRRARAAEFGGESVLGLDAGAWWRLAVLRSYATPLAFAQAARLPLAALPPATVVPCNAVQRLQALLTLQFAAPGWSARTAALAALLPQHTLRHDFNLFVGAVVPRLLEAGREAFDPRRTLEDAWLHERVQRRWQHFVLSLGEAGVDSFLQRATAHSAAPAPARRSAILPIAGRRVAPRPPAAAHVARSGAPAAGRRPAAAASAGVAC